MRSDLLLKLTRPKQEQAGMQDVEVTGPHDYVLMELRQQELKDEPDMTKVSAESMNMDERLFLLAIKRLQDKGLIEGAAMEYSDNGMPVSADLSAAKLTEAGVQYERRLG